MKKKLTAILLIFSFVLTNLSIISYANDAESYSVNPNAIQTYSYGSTVIPFYQQGPYYRTYFMLSNITDHEITVTIIMYNGDGSVVTDDNNAATGRIITSNILNYSEQVDNGTLSFTLQPHSCASVNMPIITTSYVGYGVIQWMQEGSTQTGLVAYGTIIFQTPTTYTKTALTINGGMPF